MIILGALHTLYFIFSVTTGEAIIYDTLADITKKGVIWLLGERSLLYYYNGYSLAMGLLMMCYGLFALLTERTCKSTILCTATSLIAFIISVVYFHMLAYSLTALSFILYALSLLAREKEVSQKQTAT